MDAEKPSKSCTFLRLFHYQIYGISLKMTSGYIALIEVFWDEYETNLHFKFVWTEWKKHENDQNFE